MGRRRRDETDAGLWSVQASTDPTVRVREERRRGANVILDYRDPDTGRRTKPSLGFGVRDARGRIVPELAEAAVQAAKDRAAELRLSRLRRAAEPARITVRDAFAYYHDPDRGGLPESATARAQHRRARRAWENALGPETPWNAVTRAEVRALAFRLRREGKVATAEAFVKCLRATYRWLDEVAEIDGLKNPVKGFPWRKLLEGYEPQRDRYSREELAALLRVRREADPRFALFLVLADDSGARSKAIRTLYRSAIDRPVEPAPPPELAPHGWIVFPGMKGQPPVLWFLTRFQREEIDHALTGYLRDLEAVWRAEGTDYPLFPRVMKGQTRPQVRPECYRPVNPLVPRTWLHEAEERADVEHVRGRAWHGLRRAWSDYLLGETDLATLTTAGGWTTQRTPETIYVEARRYQSRARAREALERKRGDNEDDV